MCSGFWVALEIAIYLPFSLWIFIFFLFLNPALGSNYILISVFELILGMLVELFYYVYNYCITIFTYLHFTVLYINILFI